MSLTIDDLRDVRNLLFPVKRKWFDIGIELGLKVEELNNIKAEHADHSQCLTQMILVWLKSINPPPTWKALGDALNTAPVHEVEIAGKGSHYRLLVILSIYGK